MLYQEYLPLPCARPWPLRAHAMEAAKGWAQRTSVRDAVSPHQLDAQHQAVLSRLRTAMRARPYALRTERAYKPWMRRLATFHQLTSPRKLGPEAVKEPGHIWPRSVRSRPVPRTRP
jgi:hypothetical protein